MSRSVVRRDGAHDEPMRASAPRASAPRAGPHEAMLALQRSAGNAAVLGLIHDAGGNGAPAIAGTLPPLAQREVADPTSDAPAEAQASEAPAEAPAAEEDTGRFDLDAVAGDEEGPTVRAFDAVGMQIYVLAPLRRALGFVEQQEWEDAEGLLRESGAALIEFHEHFGPSKPVLAEQMLSYRTTSATSTPTSATARATARQATPRSPRCST